VTEAQRFHTSFLEHVHNGVDRERDRLGARRLLRSEEGLHKEKPSDMMPRDSQVISEVFFRSDYFLLGQFRKQYHNLKYFRDCQCNGPRCRMQSPFRCESAK
jgi:hypothetical protein